MREGRGFADFLVGVHLVFLLLFLLLYPCFLCISFLRFDLPNSYGQILRIILICMRMNREERSRSFRNIRLTLVLANEHKSIETYVKKTNKHINAYTSVANNSETVSSVFVVFILLLLLFVFVFRMSLMCLETWRLL